MRLVMGEQMVHSAGASPSGECAGAWRELWVSQLYSARALPVSSHTSQPGDWLTASIQQP